MEAEKVQDLRVKVKFIEKFVDFEDKGETKKMQEFYKKPGGEISKPGDEEIVTRRHAQWLAHHKFIEPLKKEAKKK